MYVETGEYVSGLFGNTAAHNYNVAGGQLRQRPTRPPPGPSSRRRPGAIARLHAGRWWRGENTVVRKYREFCVFVVALKM